MNSQNKKTYSQAQRRLEEGIMTNNHAKVIQALEWGASPDAATRYPYNALTESAINTQFHGSDIAIVETLLKAGANPNSIMRHDNYMTEYPLQTIIYASALNEVNYTDNARLLRATEKLIRLLLERGANPMLTDMENKTILHKLAFAKYYWTKWLSQIDVMKTYLEQMVTIKAMNGNTPFGEFIMCLGKVNSPSVIKDKVITLLELGANIHERCNAGHTLEEYMLERNYLHTWREILAAAAAMKNLCQDNQTKGPRL